MNNIDNKQGAYFHNLNDTVTHALLHLMLQVSLTSRYVPTAKRNEILVKFLKPKLKDRSFINIKKELKMMINIARSEDGNLEEKLYELNEQSKKAKISSREQLISLLGYLNDEHSLDSQVFDEEQKAEPEVLYMLEEHLEHCFDEFGYQIAPLSIMTGSRRAVELVSVINSHGSFKAEMYEWNEETKQAHLQLHSLHLLE